MPSTAPTSIATLVDALSGGLTLLPTAAAARSLRQAYDARQRSLGRDAWELPPILSWPQFLNHLWSEAVLSGVEIRLLLNQAQEHALWIDTVSAKPAESLTSADSLADLAARAWSLANAYEATGRLRTAANTHDTRTFAAWADAFVRECARNSFVSSAALEASLQQHIEARTLAAPPTLALAGFSDLTPAQSSLLQALERAGAIITPHPLTVPTSPDALRATLTAPTEPDEFRSAAHWLRTYLEAHPTHRVGVLLPTPEDAPALESIFREVLAPELQSIAADLSSTPWEFPSERPLSALPLVSAALDLLHWAQSSLSLDRISTLLLSPYLGAPDDASLAPRFDARILRRAQILRPETTLRALLQLAAQSSREAAPPVWLSDLQTFLTQSGDLTRPRTFADWAEFFRAVPHAAHWPGPRDLNAIEFEATQAWDSALDLLATLDFRGNRVSFAAALESLARQLRQTAFIPPSTNAPIQVMSPQQSLGLTFDALVFLRATDRNWPPQSHPDPLLPFPLQQNLLMPGTDPALDTARARAFTESLLTRTSSILFTRAAENAEGPQRPSPLLPQNLLILNSPLDTPSPADEQTRIATVASEDTAPIPSLPTTEVSGGARVLKLQAACGFLAFSELRLHSSPLDDKSAGFDALESGNILHRTLEKFWNKVQTQEALRAMDRDERARLLTQCIDASIPAKLTVESDWDKAYLAVQKERLRTVLQNWLDEELQRGPFTVLGSEKEELITIGPLTLRVRMDRIDKVEGGHFFVDYKTGYAADPRQWDGPRPEEPQLPLYSLFSEPGELKGLAFAKVRAGKGIEWRGYQSELGLIPGKKIVDLDAAIDEWRHTLEHLSNDFAHGVANVNPKDFAVNCTRCAQRLLCRINPEAFLAQLEADPDADTGGDSE